MNKKHSRISWINVYIWSEWRVRKLAQDLQFTKYILINYIFDIESKTCADYTTQITTL